jgi:ferredoxin
MGKGSTNLWARRGVVMKRTVYLIEEECIGCGMCEDLCPEVFRLNPETNTAEIIKPEGGPEDPIQEAIDSCPVECIHWKDWDDVGVGTCHIEGRFIEERRKFMAVSGKYGSIVIAKIPEDEPVFVFRAQDLLTVPVLEVYKTLLTVHDSQLASDLEKEISRFRAWGKKRKIPD